VAATSKAVNLVFHKGSLLTDPSGLLSGDGKYTRQVSATQALSTPEKVTALVQEAITRQREM
jgi:hypothetical protein